MKLYYMKFKGVLIDIYLSIDQFYDYKFPEKVI